ncbi:MAG TPA: serine hydrolase domain-containing protein [Gammaproteobacteria bacterium]|nr:serine hydrolase domain-containing protein [Gammaproteobacteria bacterium]
MAAASLQARLDALAARTHEETQVPGIVLGVSVDERRTYASAGTRVVGEQRPLTLACRYELGCAGKLPLAMAAHDLARRGRLDLTDPIAEYLPELRGSQHGDSVRCEHLLSHTSGYRGTSMFDDATRALTWDALVRHLHRTPRLFAPGSVFSYEHTESVLLGEILRRVGRPVERAADALTADGAGKHRFDEHSGRFVAVADGDPLPPFWSAAFSPRRVTIDDLLSLGEAAMSVAELQRSVVRLPPTAGGPLRELLPIAYGLGSAELRGGYRGNTGVAFGQCVGLRFAADRKICVAVALNAMVPYLRDFVLTALCAEIGGRAERHDVEPLPFELRDLTGQYIGPGTAAVDVRFADQRLICRLGHEDRPGGLLVDFVLDDDGRPVLRSPIPHLSLGFFAEPSEGAMGLLLGLSAYARVGR